MTKQHYQNRAGQGKHKKEYNLKRFAELIEDSKCAPETLHRYAQAMLNRGVQFTQINYVAYAPLETMSRNGGIKRAREVVGRFAEPPFEWKYWLKRGRWA